MVRNLCITLEQNHAQKSIVPGSTLSGHLTFEVEEPKHYKQITVSLTGKGKVSWQESTGAGDGDDITYYSASEVYANLQEVVWTSSDTHDGTLPAGKHTYPFRFVLPTTCPSSYHSKIGDTTYMIEGVISKGRFKFNHKVEYPFNVVEAVSINMAATQLPVHTMKQKTVGCLCCTVGEITFTVQIPRTGFYVSEEIPVSVYVENGSGRQIRVKCELVETVDYYTRVGHKKTINSMVQHPLEHIQPHTMSGEVSLSLPIPQVRPAMQRSILIRSEYAVKVTLMIPRALNSTVNIPVSIGNTNVVQALETN